MPPGGAPPSIHQPFVEDHRRLDGLLARLLGALEIHDGAASLEIWRELDPALLGHMDAEEEHLLPALHLAREREARVIIQEHRHLRERWKELGDALSRPAAALGMLRDFVDVFRAHARGEEKILYQWTDAHVAEPHRSSAIRAVAARLRGS